jgi:hypothetical protein
MGGGVRLFSRLGYSYTPTGVQEQGCGCHRKPTRLTRPQEERKPPNSRHAAPSASEQPGLKQVFRTTVSVVGNTSAMEPMLHLPQGNTDPNAVASVIPYTAHVNIVHVI